MVEIRKMAQKEEPRGPNSKIILGGQNSELLNGLNYKTATTVNIT